jgi:hypothetical protein
LVYLINDVGDTSRFADYLIKEVEVQSEGQFLLTPAETIVACSTPDIIGFCEELGFRVLQMEAVAAVLKLATPDFYIMALRRSLASKRLGLRQRRPGSTSLNR